MLLNWLRTDWQNKILILKTDSDKGNYVSFLIIINFLFRVIQEKLRETADITKSIEK